MTDDNPLDDIREMPGGYASPREVPPRLLALGLIDRYDHIDLFDKEHAEKRRRELFEIQDVEEVLKFIEFLQRGVEWVKEAADDGDEVEWPDTMWLLEMPGKE